MKKFFFLLTGAALMFAGCAKVENENTQVVPEKGTHSVTLQATISNADTRVSADNNGIFAWQETDQISVITKYGSLEGELVFSNGITITDDKATFTFDLNEGQTLGQYAFYPAAEGCMVDSDGFIGFGLRHQLDYAPGVTNMPMLGTLSSNGASFAPVGGVIKLTVASVPSEANYLRFSVPGKKIAGTFLVDNGAIAAEDYDGSDLQAYNYVDIIIPDAYRESTMEFYIPVPTGNLGNPTFAFYKTGQTDPLYSVSPRIQGGLVIERKDIIVPPTLNALKKGAEWSYTFTSKTYDANGSETLNGKSWTLAGDGNYCGYDATKGQQFGSGKAPYKTLTLTSNFGQNYGVKDIVINTSGAADISATVSVSVGGVNFKCGNESSVSLTTSATEYTFTTPNGQLVAGDIVISYAQTSSKALYLKSINVNPDTRTPLDQVTNLSVTQDGNSKNVTVSWTGVNHASSYTVSVGNQSQTVQLAPDNLYQQIFTVPSYGNYEVTVTANPESGYKASVATTSISVVEHVRLTYVVEGSSDSVVGEVGQLISELLPADPTCSVQGYTFTGWSTTEYATAQTSEPTYVASTATLPENGMTVYAVFAKQTQTSVPASTVTYDKDDFTAEGRGVSGGTGNGTFTYTEDGVSFAFNDAFESNKDSYLRIYAGSSFSITSERSISSIVFECTGGSNGPGNLSTNSAGNFNHPTTSGTGTWTAPTAGSITSISFSASKQVRAKTIKVALKAGTITILGGWTTSPVAD